MTQIEIVRAMLGGVLIGTSAAILFLFNGRIAGVSGIIRKLAFKQSTNALHSLLFLGGLVFGAWAFEAWSGESPIPRHDFPAWLLALAGLLVATGTSLANGCTSGHGVCGLARFSRRSFIAVAIFLGTAILTTYVVRHLWGVA
ncbi:MAG TPA: YeeE/YedE thiosulfate transporter family protein [Rhodocyclaceae bacterium]|nr:YeeE/YedE thiosulfate transporter family protein [Rhodocyclaceae bacterium]